MYRGPPNNELIAQVVAAAKSLIRKHKVIWFCPGRTCNPTQRRSGRGAEQLVKLYRTTSVKNAKIVEQALHDALLGHPKYDPLATPDSRGNVSHGQTQYVYVALEGELETKVRSVYRRK